ncbi:MAG: InlB B-repeat-containing protein [Erysipelotrichaceae bacterium]|nr:InlB B-repeat-containing protein [Erysipelotrichaceae bacterium]
MKRKSIFIFCSIALMLVSSLSVLTACNKDGKHNFAEEWSNDETYHWHACADKDCKEIKDKAEHSWNSGNVTVEPTTEKEGAMVYTCTVCRREKIEKIDKLVAEKKYTITFDSKGGTAVQPIKAIAGAAITAPAAPTKYGFVFAGWYESTDGGVTLSDTEFIFAYMPARVFTLYAKWATADIKGKTFNKVDATIEWESETVKQAILVEMEMTEEQFIQAHKASIITLVFAADKDSVSVTFDQNPGEEDDKGKGIGTLLYRIKGSDIVFYDSQEDMEQEIPAHEMGLFAGSTFELSADKTTIIQSNIQPGLGTIKYKYSVVVK